MNRRADEQAVRLGLLGCGKFSRAHVRRLQEIPGATIAALADVNAENLAQLVAAFPALAEVPAYRDHHELLATDIDGVVIVTPHGLHHEHAGDALRAGKHVLCEKPLVTRPEQARELIALADARQRLLMIGYQQALLGTSRYARQQVASGALGEILACTVRIAQQWGVRRDSWRAGALGEGGFLADTGNHFLDLMLHLTGMTPEAVCAMADNDGQPVDAVTGALIRFDGGRVATLAAVGRGPASWHVTVVGTKGMIELIDRDTVRHVGADDYAGWIGTTRRELAPPADRLPATTTPDAEFVAAIRRGDLGTSDGRRGLAVAEVMGAIHASAGQGGAPIAIPPLG
jgi:predicted dehydrogenase